METKKSILFYCLLAIGLFIGCEDKLQAELTLEETFPDQTIRKLANAAANGDTNQIDQLISQGANVNAQGKFDITPLWWAFMARNYGGFVHLLQKGANPNLQMKGSHDNVMYASAMVNDSRFLEAAIKAGGDVNLVNEPDKTLPSNKSSIREGETPLFGALYSETRTNLDLLLANGANINFQDSNSETILYLAHNYTMMYYLLTKGADPTLTNKWGHTFGGLLRTKGLRLNTIQRGKKSLI